MAKGGGGSQAPATQTVTQSNEPSAIVKPYMEDILKKAQDAYGKTSQIAYSGPLSVDPNASQLGAVDMLKTLAPTLTGQGNATTSLANRTIAGDFLSPDSNPYLQGQIDAALDPVSRKYTESIMPSIASSAMANDAFGGSREDLLRLEAGRNFANEAGNITKDIVGQNYANERQAQMLAPQMLATGQQLNLMAPQVLGQAGQTEAGWANQDIQDAMTRYQLDQAAPWNGMDAYSSIVNGGNYGGTSTSNVINTAGGTSQLTNTILGALGGGGMGALGASALGLGTGGWGLIPYALGGAALGGAGGWFS